MLNPSKSDCITILSAASFLIERACFRRYQEGDGHYAVGALSLQGRWRLEQLSNG
ncbi:MAG: FIG00458039: hypothetical protein [uncultured Paraburkholderia sp.]|nr:MAG: FIG00458039: hypothetical protein [uncultured Paraburkholderia sp.]